MTGVRHASRWFELWDKRVPRLLSRGSRARIQVRLVGHMGANSFQQRCQYTELTSSLLFMRRTP
jgi:hypothetical protein